MSLQRALELAERGRGTTRPNPVVGAVVVRDGKIVGEGWHERKGGPHAEVVALQAAGERAVGATPVTHVMRGLAFAKPLFSLATPAGFEPATLSLEG